MSEFKILITADLKIPKTIYEVDEESSDTPFECKDENCPLLHIAKQICDSPKKIYSLFVVSLKPFRYVIARRRDGEFHPNLNFEFSNIIKSGICTLQEIFLEWYDFIFNYNTNSTYMHYYHNMDLMVSGNVDTYTGNSYTYHYSKTHNYWQTYIWNTYSYILLYDNLQRKFEFNNDLIAICQNLAHKYDYTTLRIEFDDKSHILTQSM
jgi:hypothetical protein